jgi:hypothetical protein
MLRVGNNEQKHKKHAVSHGMPAWGVSLAEGPSHTCEQLFTRVGTHKEWGYRNDNDMCGQLCNATQHIWCATARWARATYNIYKLTVPSGG